jgi:hypothetical protein
MTFPNIGCRTRNSLAAVSLLVVTFAAAVASAREPAILDIVSASRITGYLVWDAFPGDRTKRLKCVVTRGDAGEQLDVYLSTGKENRLLLTQRVGERLLGLSSTADNGGDMVVVTVGPAGTRTMIFSLEHMKIRKILDEEGKGMPELVRVEGDEKPAVVILQETEKGDRPIKVLVHRWNGKKYSPQGPVPWEERFKLLQKSKPPENPGPTPALPEGKVPEGKL